MYSVINRSKSFANIVNSHLNLNNIAKSLLLINNAKYIHIQIIRDKSLRLQNYKIKTFTTKIMTSDDIVFNGIVDNFNGVTVKSTQEPSENEDFKTKLSDSLKKWTEEKKRGIWFEVALSQADWVPELAKNGFKYHHTKDDYVMMYKWLPNESCNIPPYAHTMIGVGAVVVNDRNQVLVVSEKYISRPHWKLPGGFVEPGENLVEAVIREVYEETQIKTKFSSLISLRHTHCSKFNCSDIYTVFHLIPLSSEIKSCNRELSASEWMDIDLYLKNPLVHSLNKMFVQKYLENKENNIKIELEEGVHPVIKKPFCIYSATKIKDVQG